MNIFQIKGAHGKLLEDCKKSGGASLSAIELAKEDISRNIYSMLGPIFRRHVLLAKQAAALQFNEAVGDDLEITIRILDDLSNAKYAALRTYTDAVRKLIPKTKGAPKSTWGTGFDLKQLEESLDDYINSRADQLRIQGVLSRGRKPIDISFNVFLHHPLGMLCDTASYYAVLCCAVLCCAVLYCAMLCYVMLCYTML